MNENNQSGSWLYKLHQIGLYRPILFYKLIVTNLKDV